MLALFYHSITSRGCSSWQTAARRLLHVPRLLWSSPPLFTDLAAAALRLKVRPMLGCLSALVTREQTELRLASRSCLSPQQHSKVSRTAARRTASGVTLPCVPRPCPQALQRFRLRHTIEDAQHMGFEYFAQTCSVSDVTSKTVQVSLSSLSFSPPTR
jgi:hypothetical protein